MSSKLKVMFKGIGLEWRITTCPAINIKRGDLKTSENNTMPAYDDANIPLNGYHDY